MIDKGFYIEYSDGTREWIAMPSDQILERKGGYSNWSLPSDNSWQDGLARFLRYCADKHGVESEHSKVTPPCVECSDMKLRSYKPGRVCPFCDSTVTHETITYACYYEHSESGLWAYIPYVHTLKNCMVCGEAWPEYLDPAMKGQIEDE